MPNIRKVKPKQRRKKGTRKDSKINSVDLQGTERTNVKPKQHRTKRIGPIRLKNSEVKPIDLQGTGRQRRRKGAPCISCKESRVRCSLGTQCTRCKDQNRACIYSEPVRRNCELQSS
jgi:hypothetical protein